jgi:hypothetical protein
LLPIGFQPVDNDLTISLEQGVTVEKQTILIYATYPHSANQPNIPITINIEHYEEPAPTPEDWNDNWVPKANLQVNGSILQGLTNAGGKNILHIPREITVIGPNAFKELSDITTVHFGDDSKCVKIDDSAFESSDSIVTINFPTSLINLGKQCFFSCDSLTAIDLSSNTQITTIPDSFCSMCEKITTLKLPPNCNAIHDSAFKDTLSLDGELQIPKTVATIGSEAFLNAGYTYGATKNISLTFEIGSVLNSIGYAAFSSMYSTGTIDLPTSLKTYNNNCFNTNKASRININYSGKPNFGDTVFEGASLTTLYLNVGEYFTYPNNFLRYSQISKDASAKIYVPSNLLSEFQNG